MQTPASSQERPILILSASAGAGHLVAGRALEEALRSRGAPAPIEVVDVLAVASGFFRRLYAGGYLWLVRRAPLLMGLLYEQMDRSTPNAGDRLRRYIQDAHTPRIARYLRARNPRWIVNTHFLPAEIVAGMRCRGELTCGQYTVTTDFETHRLWVQEPTERYYVASEQGRNLLVAWGVEPSRIRLTGIPVRSGFRPPEDRGAIRAALGVAPAAPLVLLLCGGFGVGPVVQTFEELQSRTQSAQIAVICGNNEALRAKLSVVGDKTRSRIVGFTDELHRWMQAADLVVTKPGGLSVSEALACGAPMVLVNPIPGQETRNSDFLLESGAAVKANDVRLVGPRVRALLDSPPELAKMREAALRTARPHAADEIAADLISDLSQRPV